MTYLKTVYIFISLFIVIQLPSQVPDSLQFVAPVDHEIRLSGNFMELRKNHFHTGIDIKSSNGRVGDPVRVIAEGYVSRVKVQSGSYGQVLYVDHPGGLTSVYAHLHRFSDEMESYIKALQYSLESYELDIYLPDSLFILERGQLIGQMGNTGRSFGPHLHFEIRDTRTETPLNPEDYGFAPDDNIPPTMQSLEVYFLDGFNNVQESETRYLRKQAKTYSLYSTIRVPDSLSVGFGLQCFDQINGSTNRNGIDACRMFLDDSLVYEWAAEDYSFSESRKINGFIDYRKYAATGNRIYKLYQPDCAGLNYLKGKPSGILKLGGDSLHFIRIETLDAQGNISTLEFSVEGDGSARLKAQQNGCDSSFSVKRGMFEIHFPPSSFFHRPQNLQILKEQGQILGQSCHKLTILDPSTPMASYYQVHCPLPPGNPVQWCYITQDNRGRWNVFSADTLDNRLSVHLDQCGVFYLFRDTEPPQVELLRLDLEEDGAIIFRIKDNLIPDGQTPDLFYEARAGGKWLRFKYDLKTDRIIFTDIDVLPDGNFEFELVVRDAQDNSFVYKRNMIKS